MKDEVNSQPVKLVIEHIKNKSQSAGFCLVNVYRLNGNYLNFCRSAARMFVKLYKRWSYMEL